jgi:hypothetical protein
MKPLMTWRKKSCFCYSGSIKDGTSIRYGSGYPVQVTASQYQALLNHFKGREVDIGTSRDKATDESVGKWLQQNVTKTAIASYVGPILIAEGYAEKGSTPSKIRFK